MSTRRSPTVLAILVTVVLALGGALRAQEGEQPPKTEDTPPKTTEETPGQETQDPPEAAAPEIPWEKGKITIGSNLATVDMPEGYGFLRGMKARKMVESWGNPDDPSILGLIATLDAESDGFAVIISYDDSGYVADDDAANLDYDEMEQQMKDGSAEESKARVKAGLPSIQFLGWAEAPHYDSTAKKLYWAQRLRFGGEDGETLNYNVRILGAGGVLIYNAVASVSQLEQVAKGSKELLRATEFLEGNRYEDHNPSIHKVAAYGIGGLIAGKLLLKGGILKLLLANLKFILIGLAAVGGAIWKFMSGRRDPQPAVERVRARRAAAEEEDEEDERA